MIGSLLSPTFSKSHHHGAGFQGSPVEAKARREERSWRWKGDLYVEPSDVCEVTAGSTLFSACVEPLLTCGLRTPSSHAARARMRVGEMPRISTLCLAVNSHM